MSETKQEPNSRKVWYWAGGIGAAVILVVVVLWVTGIVGSTPPP